MPDVVTVCLNKDDDDDEGDDDDGGGGGGRVGEGEDWKWAFIRG